MRNENEDCNCTAQFYTCICTEEYSEIFMRCTGVLILSTITLIRVIFMQNDIVFTGDDNTHIHHIRKFKPLTYWHVNALLT